MKRRIAGTILVMIASSLFFSSILESMHPGLYYWHVFGYIFLLFLCLISGIWLIFGSTNKY